MSANQKQPPSVPQSQSRYPQAQYVPQRPHTPQRNDSYHVGTPPTYVQQPPPNQVNNQVQPLRGMPPTGPPNQASTPPNNDLKVQQMSQPPPMNIAYVPQSQMRPQTQQSYFSRPPAPTNQTRLPNHRQSQQAIYQPQPAQYLQMPLSTHHMTYINASPAPVQYYNSNSRPPNYVTSGYPMITPQLQGYSYQQPQAHPQSYFFNPATQLISRTTPQVQAAPQNPTQPSPAPNMVMQQPVLPHNTVAKNKRRSNAIPIIDPNTGRDRLNEMYEQEQDSSHPPSGESSARQTPQPSLPNPNKEVQAAFAKQVAQAIGKDEPLIDELDHPTSVHEHMGHMYPLPTQAVHSRIDLVQSSKLQAATKEFVPASHSTAKETTPVVSALTDAVEVTITNKPKDRESPAKIRKQREHIVVTRDNKEKDISKDLLVNNKPLNVSCNKDDIIQKDVVLSVGTNKDGVIQRDEKKNQKKVDVKPLPPPCVSVSEESLSESGPVIPSSIPETTSFYSTKSKSNSSQKSKDVPKQSPPTLPPTVVQTPTPPVPQKVVQPTPVVVPATQPSKPTSKNSKQRELNLKGASKEGTDMDAYNDNIIDNEPLSATINTTENVTNVNHTTNDNSETIEYINNNSNNLMLNNNVNISNSTVVVPTDTNKKIENSTSDTATIKPNETKPVKKIDVTDIVTDIPRPFIAATASSQFNSATTNALSTFKQPTAPSSLDSLDETDRAAAPISEKLVQTKSDIKSSPTEANVTNDVRSRLCYRDDQWSPANTDGKKVYPRDFLLALSKDTLSLKRPDNLPTEIQKNDDKAGRVGDISRFSIGARGGPDFSPSFSSNSYPNKSSSQRGAVSKRKSQQGAVSTSKGGLNNNNKPTVRYTLSLKDEVIKLHEAENAWRPARSAHGGKMTEYERQTADLYRKVRGVLNKLTPQKFDTLLDQIRNLNIDNPQRLQGVIDLVFEKAVDEPNFSVAYALLCRELALMQVPLNNEGDKEKEDTAAEAVSKKEGSAEYVNFRKLLVTRCQMEFEKNSIDESARNAKVVLIESCEDPEKKKEMLHELEEYDRKLRMKSVGNIRFIGELFKQNMLTVNIMQRCLSNLLETKDEESLECLCKLLTTIGLVLASKNFDMSPVFNVMRDIVDKKHGKISSRVRFMLQDVMDLRLSNWVPRRQDLNPKTMDQIQKEAENEQQSIHALNSVPITPRRDDRGASGTNKGNSTSNKKYGNVSNDEGWVTTASRGGNRSFSVQSEKLKSKPPTGDEPLGSSSMFGSWGRGANIKNAQLPINTTNMYATLDSLGNECDKRNLNIRTGGNKGPYNSKGPSLERNYNRPYDGRGSRSGSQHRSRDSSAASQRNAAPAVLAPVIPKSQPTFVEPPAPEPVPVELSLEKMERKFINIIDEFINNCCSVQECEHDVGTSIPPTVLPQLILAGCVHVLERSKVVRLRTGALFSHLIKSGVLSVQGYCEGLESVMTEAQELIIDIPTIWESVAELIAPVLWDNAATLRDIYKAFKEPIKSNHAHKLLAYTFKLFVFEKGPIFVGTLWKNSNFAFTDFMPEAQIENFIKDNNFGFLLDSSNFAASTGQTQLSYEEIHSKLLDLFTEKSSFDSIINWILANVGGAVKENQFIRTLATACFESSIVSEKLKGDILEEKYNFFKRFVDTNPTYELQCLFALQSLINKMEHPQGLLLSICNKLYEDNIFSHESFMAWEINADPAEQEGKGVALKQLTSFFVELKTGEDESSSSASEEN